jgi:hypothetical protein
MTTPIHHNPDMVIAHANALAAGTSLFVSVNFQNSEAKQGRLCWPPQENGAIVKAASLGRDTYINPAHVQLGHRGGPPKLEHITGSHFAWADFDHGLAGLARLPKPSILVRSSSADKQHAYWRCADVLTPDETEAVDLGIIRAGDSDPQCWGRNRLLRLAGSWRPSKQCLVELLYVDGPTYAKDELLALANPEDKERQSLARCRGACDMRGGTVDWVVAMEHARRYARVTELPEECPEKAKMLFANDLPLAQLNELMQAAEWTERPYSGWTAVMLAMAASLRHDGMDIQEIAGLLYAWRKRPVVMAGGNRSNDERQILRGIEFAIANAYAPDEGEPERPLEGMFS